MMKKQTAMEKHLQEIIDKQRKDLKEITEKYNCLFSKYSVVSAEKEDLSAKVAEQEDWIRRLLEYTDLSEEDVIRMKKAELSNEKYSHVFGVITKMFGGAL